MLPPEVKEKYEDCDVWQQAKIIAYELIRDYEDAEMLGAFSSLRS